MMEEQELLEWAEREKEIDRVQTERLDALQAALEARDRENEFIQDQRVEELRRKKMEEKDRVHACTSPHQPTNRACCMLTHPLLCPPSLPGCGCNSKEAHHSLAQTC